MEKESNKELLQRFLGKRVLILTQKDLVYNADIKEISDNFVIFLDKYKAEVCLAIEDIKQITGRKPDDF